MNYKNRAMHKNGYTEKMLRTGLIEGPNKSNNFMRS